MIICNRRYRLTAAYLSGERTSWLKKSHRHLLSLLGQFGQFSRKGRPVGRLLAFTPGKARTRIRFITKRHSLLPTSYTRIPIGCPYDHPTQKGGIRGYHVPHKYPNRLGFAPTPTALHLRQRSYEPLHLAAHLLVKAYQHLWLFLVTTLQRFTYVNHTAQF